MKQPEEFDELEELQQTGESLTELEEYLTQALRHVDAPAGFAERTMARAKVADGTRARILPMPTRLRAWSSGAIAAALAAGVFIGQQVHVRHQREKVEAAQQQFDAAMRITGETLEHTRLELQRAGVPMGQD